MSATVEPERMGERVDGVLVGGYETEIDPVASALADPVEPPLKWSDHEKLAALQTYEGWLLMGMAFGYCSEPVCNTHNGLPATREEEAEWDEGLDPCVPAVRLYPDGLPTPVDG